MGLFDFLRGGGDSNNSGSDNRRCSRDGTCFRDATDRRHVVIERPKGGKLSVGHNRSGGGTLRGSRKK